jgi:photosystem II stability/assembly factor-like uncharacterized protein
VTSISVLPGGQAWAFGFRCTSSVPFCNKGTLYHSGDHGSSWRAISSLPIYTVSFADKSDGMAVLLPNACDPDCSPFTSLATSTDAGKTWQRINTPCGHNQFDLQVQGVSLVTRTRGWLMCMGHFGQTGKPPNLHESAAKSIYRTDNGGHTWKLVLAVNAGTVSGLPRVGAPFGIAFNGKGDGVIWETLGSQYLTRDGGLHWQPLEPAEKTDGLAGSATSQAFAVLLTPSAQVIGSVNTVRLAETTASKPQLQTTRTWRYR